MPFEIIREDITNLKVDAIVNAAKNSLLGGGGVDGAIHSAAGSGLLKECKTLGGCETGQAKITKGYKLFSKYVIHTVGPIWKGGNNNEEQLLYSCYKNSLDLAIEYKLESIAFPLISSGVFGYPKDKALNIAISAISSYLMNHDLTIYLVVYDKKAFVLTEKLFFSVKSFIDDNYIDENTFYRTEQYNKMELCSDSLMAESSKRSLDDVMKELEDTFSEYLLRQIDIKEKTDVEIYKKANVDRKLFSKIRNNKNYKPSKPTAIAFAIALELNLDETKDFLEKAGFALSHSNKFDVIIEYFINESNYNIYEINETLFAFDQHMLGIK